MFLCLEVGQKHGLRPQSHTASCSQALVLPWTCLMGLQASSLRRWGCPERRGKCGTIHLSNTRPGHHMPHAMHLVAAGAQCTISAHKRFSKLPSWWQAW